MKAQLAADINEASESSVEALQNRLDKSSQYIYMLLAEFRKATSDRDVTAAIVESLRAPGTVSVSKLQLLKVITSIENTNVMIKKRGGIHSRECAVFPHEIPPPALVDMFDDEYRPQYTEKGPCNCGLGRLDDDTNEALEFLRKVTK